jgi:hypothetical protein
MRTFLAALALTCVTPSVVAKGSGHRTSRLTKQSQFLEAHLKLHQVFTINATSSPNHRLGWAIRASIYMLALLLPSAASCADVYRCDAGGKVTYQQTPCDGGAQRKVDAQPHGVSSAIRKSSSLEHCSTSDKDYVACAERNLEKEIASAESERHQGGIKARYERKMKDYLARTQGPVPYIGMTRAEFNKGTRFGLKYTVNTTMTAGKQREQLVMMSENDSYTVAYVYFEDGVLTAIQTGSR